MLNVIVLIDHERLGGLRRFRAQELRDGAYPTIEVFEACRGFISMEFIQPAFLIRELGEPGAVRANTSEGGKGQGKDGLDSVEACDLEGGEVRGEDGGRG